MRAICWTSIALLGLAASPAWSDDQPLSGTDPDDEKAVAVDEILLGELEFKSRVLPYDADAGPVEIERFAVPLTGLELRASNTIKRITDARRLSLLTLAEIGKRQLFFGVNSDGTLGFHFGASPRVRATSYAGPADLPDLRGRPGFLR